MQYIPTSAFNSVQFPSLLVDVRGGFITQETHMHTQEKYY